MWKKRHYGQKNGTAMLQKHMISDAKDMGVRVTSTCILFQTGPIDDSVLMMKSAILEKDCYI